MSPTFQPTSALHRLLGADADATCRHDQLAVLVVVLDDGLAEDELAGATAFLLPRLARLHGRRQHVADAHRSCVLVVLLGMQPGAASTAAALATAVRRPTARL